METTGAHHPPSPERYVSRVELAQLMGISVSTIDRLVGNGMPSVVWAKRCRRFLASEAIAWAQQQQRPADER